MFYKCVCYNFSIVAINAVKKSVWSLLVDKKGALSHEQSVLTHMVDVFHLFHVLQTFSMFYNPRLQDSTICRKCSAALASTELQRIIGEVVVTHIFALTSFSVNHHHIDPNV